MTGSPENSSVESRLRRLEDVEAICDLKMAYAQLCDDNYDAKGIVALFADFDDVSWESDIFGRHRGKNAILSFFENVGDEILWALHFITNPSVRVTEDGLNATGHFYLLELATMTSLGEGDPDAVVMSGKYSDEFVKVDGEWRFKKIQIVFEQTSNLDQGWVRQQFRTRGA